MQVPGHKYNIEKADKYVMPVYPKAFMGKPKDLNSANRYKNKKSLEPDVGTYNP
jgi:hypothetical protein